MKELSDAEREELRQKMVDHYHRRGKETIERISEQKRVVQSNVARISLICGILSLIPISIAFSGFILPIAAIAFGIVGLNTIINKGSKPFEYTGKGKAIGGIVLGGIMLLLRILGLFSLFGT